MLTVSNNSRSLPKFLIKDLRKRFFEKFVYEAYFETITELLLAQVTF